MIAFFISSLRCAARTGQPGHPVDHVDHQIEAVDLVEDRELERRVDVALLLVAAHVQVLVVREAVGELVDQPGIAVEVEDHRLVGGEQAVELAVRRAVRVLARRLHLVQVHHVDEAHLQVGQPLAQDRGGRQRLLTSARRRTRPSPRRARRPRRCWRGARCRCPWRSARSPRRWSMNCRCFCLSATITLMQSVERRQWSATDQQAVGVGRQVDARHGRALVGDHVDEARVLVREAVVILAPDGRGQQDVLATPPRRARARGSCRCRATWRAG